MITAKKSLPNIVPVWQPIGQSTYRITMQIAQKYDIKTAHTGVLDPLAEGVIIVLSGDERFNKIDYAGWKKSYEFEITFGLATDSYDGMGFITEKKLNSTLDPVELTEVIPKFIGSYSQKVPLYSATKLNGKRLFEYPKLGIEVKNLPEKKGEIYSFELLSMNKVKLRDQIELVMSNINKVEHGEFRQKETLAAWENYFSELADIMVDTATFRVSISRGMYVRSLSQDIAKSLNTVGFITKLVRTKNGIYDKQACFELSDVLN